MPRRESEGQLNFGLKIEQEGQSVVNSYGEASVIGRRWEMEDAHIVIPKFRSPHEFFAAVYDGHSGRSVADFAVSNLDANLDNALTRLDPQSALTEAFLKTDQAIRDQHLDSGSTAVVAYIDNKTLYVANAGDARAVLGRFGHNKRLSHDHKADDPEEVERIKKLGGFVTFPPVTAIPRVNGRLAIARSLGDHLAYPNFPDTDFITANPFVSKTELQPEDDVLILACDGVWDVLSDQEAVDFTRKSLRTTSASETAILLKDEALRKGSRDNITAIVIKLQVTD